MISDLRTHLKISPFVPFRIRMADGQEYSVPTSDHVAIPPTGGRAVVFDDEGHASILSGLLMTALIVERPPEFTT